MRVGGLLWKDGRGLNLTWEVRDGTSSHSKSRQDIFTERHGKAATLEGEISKIADAIAYINHDIGDAIRAGIITENDLPPSAVALLGHSHRERINTMVCDIISNSWAVTAPETTPDEPKTSGRPLILMSHRVGKATNELRQFLFNRVYNVQSARQEAKKAREVIRQLYKYFTRHEDSLPPEYRLYSDEAERRVVDYIAGMTDQYATRLAEEPAPASKDKNG